MLCNDISMSVQLIDNTGQSICYSEVIFVPDSSNVIFEQNHQTFNIGFNYNNVTCSVVYAGNAEVIANAVNIQYINVQVYRSSSVYIAPEGLHFQINENKYIRLDEDGLDLQNVKITPQYTNMVAANNYIISDKSDAGSMEVFFGNKDYQYFHGTNQYIEISGSNFFLSSSGQLFMSGGGSGPGVSVHNDLTGIQGGSASHYYHLGYADYQNVLSGSFSGSGG